MLGILIAASTVAVIGVLTLARRDLPLFILIAIFILTAEMGEGFTSFQGSIFFNQNFLNLAKLKWIEVILYSYAGMLVLLQIPGRQKPAPSPLRQLYWLWLIWLVVLLYVQFGMHGFIDIFGFRGVYLGFVLLYVFASAIDSRLVMKRVIVFALILIVVKVMWLLLMFAAGRGENTTRGYSPIFWDDNLLELFTWAFLILLVCLLQPRNKSGNWPTVLVSIGLVLLFVIVALSLRRNNLGQLLVGTLLVLLSRGRQIQWQRVLTVSVILVFLLGVLFTAGLVLGNRLPLARQLNEYAQLLNFTSITTFTSLPENQVHISNLKSYIAMITEYPGIRYFGRSAAPSDNFRDFNREYMSSLGLAHNAPLRAIFDFGIGGLVIWAGFFVLAFLAIRRSKFKLLEPWEQAVLLGSAASIFSHLIVTLTFIPPFFTTAKGIFVFLFSVYCIEFYSRQSQLLETETTEAEPVRQPVNSYKSVQI